MNFPEFLVCAHQESVASGTPRLPQDHFCRIWPLKDSIELYLWFCLEIKSHCRILWSLLKNHEGTFRDQWRVTMVSAGLWVHKFITYLCWSIWAQESSCCKNPMVQTHHFQGTGKILTLRHVNQIELRWTKHNGRVSSWTWTSLPFVEQYAPIPKVESATTRRFPLDLVDLAAPSGELRTKNTDTYGWPMTRLRSCYCVFTKHPILITLESIMLK